MSNIDKRKLISLIYQKLQKKVPSSHISSIVNIFVEEFWNELQTKKVINIDNFGKFIYKKTKPRRYFDIVRSKVAISNGRYKLYFRPNRRLKKLFLNLQKENKNE